MNNMRSSYIIIKIFLTGAIILLLYNCSCGPVAEPEIHFIPEGFIGHVKIIHNQLNGEELRYDNNARVYQIPKDGILRVKGRANFGIRKPEKMKFYYVNSVTGKRYQIPVSPFDKTITDSTVCIIGGYQVSDVFHYFVDQHKNAQKYKNPAIEEGERKTE